MAFHPAHLLVAAGDTVVWINKDIVPHTATATGARAWDTGTIASQDSSRQIVKAGADSSYACALHPTMEATLVVR